MNILKFYHLYKEINNSTSAPYHVQGTFWEKYDLETRHYGITVRATYPQPYGGTPKEYSFYAYHKESGNVITQTGFIAATLFSKIRKKAR